MSQSINRKNILLLFCAILFVKWGMAGLPPVKDGDDCKSIISNLYKNFSFTQLPAPGKAYIIDMTLTTSYAAYLNSPPVSTFLRIELTDSYYSYENDFMNIYMDKQDLFYVNHQNKSIVKTSSTWEALKDQQMGDLFTLRDSIFERFEVKECLSIKDDDGKTSLRRIKIETTDEEAENIGIKSIDYTINEATGLPKKIEIKYDKDKEVEKAIYEFKYIDFNAKSSNRTALSFITDKKGNLLTKYQNYKFFNN